MNLLNDLASVVEKFSPLIGSALGSPLGGVLVTFIAHAIKANPTDVKDIIDKIKTDPDAEVKIKEMEAMVNDLQNARNREVAYTNATKQRDWMLPLLAVIVVLGFFVTTWVVMFADIDQDEKYFLFCLILGIGVQFAQVYNYYFGRFNDELLRMLSTPFVKIYNGIFKKP